MSRQQTQTLAKTDVQERHSCEVDASKEVPEITSGLLCM